MNFTLEDLTAIPQELKNSGRWLLWRLEDRQGRERCKVPKTTTGQNASVTDPNTWCELENAIEAFPNLQPERKYADVENNRGIGLVIGTPFIGVDLDKCLDPATGVLEEWAQQIIDSLPETYTEFSPSGKGVHLWFRCDDHQKLEDAKRTQRAEVYARNRYFTVTGQPFRDASSKLATLSLAQVQSIYHSVESLRRQASESKTDTRPAPREDEQLALLLKGNIVEAGFPDSSGDSGADLRLCSILAKKFNGNRKLIELTWLNSGLKREKLNRDDYRESTISKALEGFKTSSKYEGDGSDWREDCFSYGQLPTELPRFLIGGLIPEKALTAIPAPSYNCKTWFSLACAKAISTGRPLWCFEGPQAPIPVIYHVPEMNAAFVRQYMGALEFEDSDMFLARPMEKALWALNDPRMLKSSEGRVVFLDTAGYFNEAEDTSNYQQSLQFARRVYDLLNIGGAISVVALFHPPKYSKLENQPWSLENSILGSAGYGGILRSCIRLQNLNPDLNDPNVRVYVQGLKNPGLKPFQLEGPLPLKMKVPPGESPYLATLLKEQKGEIDPRYSKACEMFRDGQPQRNVTKKLKCSNDTESAWRKRWKAESETADEEARPTGLF